MDIIKAIHAFRNLLTSIAEHFEVDVSKIRVDYSEAVFTVNVCPRRNYTDADFHRFCKENDLKGVIFFNGSYGNGYAHPVTFSMTPKNNHS